MLFAVWFLLSPNQKQERETYWYVALKMILITRNNFKSLGNKSWVKATYDQNG